MEKDSRKNQKIHKNVGLFKSTIDRKTRIKIGYAAFFTRVFIYAART